MSLMSIKRYNQLKYIADTKLKNKLGASYDSMPQGYKDAYANAYAQNMNMNENGFNQNRNASDKEIQNWAQGKNIRDNNEGGWEDDLFDDLFQPDGNGGYEPNPNTSFMTNDGDLSKSERDKCLGYLSDNDSSLGEIGEKFTDSKTSGIYAIDPLLIDLDGNGIETTPLTDGMMMDHDKDGFKELSAWVGGNDGILVYDKNKNGYIDNGNELFGDNYVKSDGTVATSGFDALSDLDTNKDGVINSSDENFSDLQVIKADGSIISIEEAGIESINLTYQSKGDVDVNGNKLLGLGSYTTIDGETRKIGDYSLQVNKTISIEADKIEIPADIEELPYVSGYGVVHNLHYAMAIDETGELQQLVESFVAETDIGEKKQLLNQILYKWTGADSVEDGSRGENFDAKQLHVLEQFLNDNFIGKEGTPNPNPQAANLLLSTYTDLSQLIYAQLEVQTGLKSVYDMIQFKTDADTGTLICDISAVKDHIAGVIATDELAGQMLLTDFCQTFLTLGYDENSNYSEFYDYFASYGQDYVMLLDSADKIVRYGTNADDNIEGTAEQEAVFAQGGNDTIYTRQGDDLVYAGDGDDYIDTCEDNDKIYGENGNDTIITGWGNDTVYGGDGDDSIHNTGDQDYLDGGDGNDTLIGYWAGGDTFIGGKGDDVITAYSTNDTFIFNFGDGNDTISDSKGTDIIKFGEGITAENTIFSTEGSDMKITFKNSNDSILIKNAASVPDNRIESYEFSDGTVYTIEDVLTKLTTYGTSGDDTITLSFLNNKVYGYEGNDSIITGRGNDTVYGGDGDDLIQNKGGQDYLDGGDGNDTLIGYWSGGDTFIGGTGDDNITAYSTNDTFIFNLGDGHDTISDSKGTDTIKFGEGITAGNTIFTGLDKDNAMLITFKNSDDSILIKNATSSSSNRIEFYEYSDGTVLTIDEVLSKVATHGTNSNDILTDSLLPEKLFGYAGNDSITVKYGNDTVFGGEGNDTLISNGVNNILEGGLGDDYLQGAVWNDTYVFNLGDGNDTIFDHNGTDTLQFGEGINAENTIFSTEGSHIKITFKNSEDSILLKDAASSSDRRIESFKYSDGTIITKEEMLQMLVNHGTSADDTMTGSVLSEKIYGYDGNDSIISGNGNDTVYGGSGDDYIENNGGNDILYGEAGNDTIINKSSDSTMIGGLGNDYLQGAVWNDTYIFNLGDGNDTIFDQRGTDTLKFGEGITLENIVFTGVKNGNDNDFLITFKDTNDSILIKQGANTGDNEINKFIFSDGTELTVSEAKSLTTTYGTNSNDILTGSVLSEKIYGYEGNDSINSSDGNDTVYGGAGDDYIENSKGNDVLYGESGNDTIVNNGQNSTIIGGLGNDSIQGGLYSDVYMFSLGDGSDTISDTRGTDTLQFGVGISIDNIVFTGLTQGDDLLITFKNSNDSILVKNGAYEGDKKIEKYIFADGSELSFADVQNRAVINGTEFNDTITGSIFHEKIYGFDGNDSITSSGYDYIDGGSGNDTIINTGSNATIIGGQGDDYIESAVWNDTYIFNLGDGNDTILDKNGTDTLQFGEGITAENTIFSTEGSHIKITFKNSEDSILLKDAASSSDRRIESFKYSDGTIITKEEMLQMLVNHGTSADDTMTGSVLSEKIYGYDGNDSIVSDKGDDTVYGGDGDDYIKNTNGNDYIDGGAGNDSIVLSGGYDNTVIGGLGNDSITNTGYRNDTYIFNLGDGNDTIQDNNGTDTLIFGEGITLDNIIFTGLKNGSDNDFLITFRGTDDSILIKYAAQSTNNQIEKYVFSDGTEISFEDVKNLVTTHGTTADDTLKGSVMSEKIYGYDGNDYILSDKGNDTVYGGEGHDYIENSNGSDVLYGGAGNDTIIISGSPGNTLIGGPGNDSMRGNSWDDTFIFNLGDGNDTIEARGGNDTIEFDSSVDKDDIAIFIDKQNNLFIDYGQENDTDRIKAVGNSVENVIIGDYTLTNNAINQLIQDMSAYATEQGMSITSVDDVKNNEDLMTMVNSAWTGAA